MTVQYADRSVGKFIKTGYLKGAARKKVQWAALRRHLNHCREHSPYYRRILMDFPVSCDWKTGFREFARLPVTRKDDLRNNNDLFFAVPPSQWADLFATSGATGEKVYLPYTRGDLDRMAVAAGVAYAMGGMAPGDLALLTLPMGVNLWQGGLGFYGALQAVGAGVLRHGPGFHERALDLIERFPVNTLLGAPSFLSSFAPHMKDEVDPRRGKIRKILTVGEECMSREGEGNPLRRKLQTAWPMAKVIAGYGSTEAGCMACDCGAGYGYHYSASHLIVEVLSPETGLPLEKEGETGELVLTPLGLTGAPLVRFASGDVAEVRPGPCVCGYDAPSIGPIVGRLQNRMKIRGVSLFPEAVEKTLAGFPEIVLWQMEAFRDDAGGEALRIRYAAPALTDPKAREAAEARWTETFRGLFGVAFPLRMEDPGVLSAALRPAGEVKPRKFVDLR